LRKSLKIKYLYDGKLRGTLFKNLAKEYIIVHSEKRIEKFLKQFFNNNKDIKSIINFLFDNKVIVKSNNKLLAKMYE
jgi:hypothetical protein